MEFDEAHVQRILHRVSRCLAIEALDNSGRKDLVSQLCVFGTKFPSDGVYLSSGFLGNLSCRNRGDPARAQELLPGDSYVVAFWVA